jgi:Domain of unknown function (DUF4136)
MKPNLVLYSLLAVCLTGCSMKIYSDYDHSISIKKYKTFGWPDHEKMDIKNNTLYNAQTEKIIWREVALQLNKKGYQFSELQPDLRMHYHIVSENWAITPDPFGYSYDSYWINREIHLYELREGTLIIDLVDPKTDFLIWRGWVVNFKNEKKPRQIESQIIKATQKIFETFPVQENK